MLPPQRTSIKVWHSTGKSGYDGKKMDYSYVHKNSIARIKQRFAN